MLKICSKALLLTDVENFAEMYRDIAEENEVSLRVEESWKSNYRITEEVVICGSKYLESINASYYANIVLLLKDGEKPYAYIKKGIERFIFNCTNRKELSFAFLTKEKELSKDSTKDLKLIVKNAVTLKFVTGDYNFDFGKGIFKWRGKGIYLTNQTINYLAEWLLNGNKDNSRRLLLFNARKRLGKDFLKDVDRFGQLKEVKNEREDSKED